MGNNVQGFEYENEVIEALKEAGCCGSITEGAGASASDADADFIVDGVRHLVEIKKDSFAQMGGTSARYINQEFEIASDAVDQDTQQMIVDVLGTKTEAIDSLLGEIGATQFPTSCTKHQWDDAKRRGLLKPINAKVSRGTSFIIDHYYKKGINYIQIGGDGLYHMSANPANLPIPALDVTARVRIRTKTTSSIPVYNYRFTTALLVQSKPQRSTLDLDRRADLEKLVA